MNCWQIIYNASPSGISGASGFGVRTATEGIPKEILDRVGRDTALMAYAPGTFNIGNEQRILMDAPERIYEWPRRYFYKEIPLNADQKIYVLGRAVNAGFDHSFYSTKTMCRPGNFIVHTFVFDQKPDKAVFSLLQEKVGLGMSSFYPADYRPSLDNHQMLYLMTGKPEYLPKEDFSPQKWEGPVCPEAYDLFFQYRESVLAGKPFAVKMPAAKTAEACAGLMRLLPPSVASDTTFEINHQNQGLSAGAKITFVNEYYLFMISPLTCHLLDCNVGHVPSRLEEQYRSRLEKAVSEGDETLAGRLAEWIWSDIAISNMDASKELNLALFNYCHDQDKFKADDILKVSGLLPTLIRWIGSDADRAALLMTRLMSGFENASTAEEFETALTLCEKVRAAGLDVGCVIDTSRRYLTAYAVDRPTFFARLLEKFGLSLVKVYIDQIQCKGRTYILDDYSMKEWWGRTFWLFWKEPYDARAILSRMLELHVDDAQIKEVLSSVLPSQEERVNLYLTMLKDNTSILLSLMPLLEWDRPASDKVDYMSEFRQFHDSSAFAPLFFRQLVTNLSPTQKVTDVIRQYSYMCGVNTAFAVRLFKDGSGVYSQLLERVVRSKPKSQDFEKWAELIKTHILDVLPDSVPSKRDWAILLRVLLAQKPAGDARRYYSLAVELGAAEAVAAVAPDMFDYLLAEDEIRKFTSVLLNFGVMDKDKILARAKKSGSDSLKGFYAVAVLKSSDYQEIKSVAEKLDVTDVKSFIKTCFPEVYKAQRRKEILGKVNGFFAGLFAKNETPAKAGKPKETNKKK